MVITLAFEPLTTKERKIDLNELLFSCSVLSDSLEETLMPRKIEGKNQVGSRR